MASLDPQEPLITDCPLGFVCQGNETFPCDRIRSNALAFGFGDIYAGIYCPANYSVLFNCPVGYYCPDPSSLIPCPSGHFCPHKSSRVYIRCASCDRAADEMQRHWAGYTTITLLIVGTFIAWLNRKRLKQVLNNARDKLKALEMKSMNESQIKVQEDDILREKIQRIKPKLGILRARLESTDDTMNIDYLLTPAKIFEDLDTDNDGELSYGEINAMLQLDDDQLKAFVESMNELGGLPKNTKTVNCDIFQNYFLDVLERAAFVKATPQDAEILWLEIAEAHKYNRDDKLPYNYFYESSLSNFLSDAQILFLIRYLKQQIEQSPIEVSGTEEHAVDNLSYRDPASLSLRTTSNLMHGEVSLEEFKLHYPSALQKVAGKTSRDLTSQGNEIKGVGLDIAFKDLSLTVKKGDAEMKVVNSCSGRLRSNSMTAILGGSGAGKTSLLNALCGRAPYGVVTGETRINGKLATIDDHRDSIGFVPQDDIVYAELTVRENFLFSGKLRLPRETSEQEIYDLADEIITSLGLRRVADNLVGDHRRRGLSGGERKRVNIGLELMARPSFCALDEPTSGLDSFSALTVMSSLRYLVESRGVTMAAVIHQPRRTIFELFDTLILLGVGGRMIYHGDTKDVQNYFSDLGYVLEPGEALADWLIDISSGSLKPELHQNESTRSEILLRGASSSQVMGEKTAGAFGVNTGSSAQNDLKLAKVRREKLYTAWTSHISNLPESDPFKKYYDFPNDMKIPISAQKQSFVTQFKIQSQRIFVLWSRAWFSKLLDLSLIVGVSTIVTYVNGVVKSTILDYPAIPYDVLTSSNPEQVAPFMPAVFSYSTVSAIRMAGPIAVITLVTSMVLMIASLKALVTYRDNFFREASSGVGISPYFAAVNLTLLVETSVQMFITGYGAYWARQSFASARNYIVVYMIIGWLTSSWAVLLPLFISPDSIVIAASVFVALFAVVLAGATQGLAIKDFYENGFLGFLAGLFPVNRFALEQLVVSEQRCLMPQAGYALGKESTNFPLQANSYNIIGYAQNDFDTVTKQSCDGWYWSLGPAVLVGITIRILASAMIHVTNRGACGKKSISHAFANDRNFRIGAAIYSCVFVGFFSWSVSAYMRDRD